MNNQRIRIVLIETSHPGNIGAAARAMKTMCLSELYLVNPQQYPCVEATARAAGADDVLAAARVVESLPEALVGCTTVFGTSARLRSQRWPIVSPREAAAELAPLSDGQDIALVFGRERTGLTNEEMGYCHKLIHIPVNPDYSSLNLASAVQVMAYEMHSLENSSVIPDEPLRSGEGPADVQDVERFFAHLEEALVAVDYLDPNDPKHLMLRMRRLFNKSNLTEVEVRILRGVLKQVIQSSSIKK